LLLVLGVFELFHEALSFPLLECIGLAAVDTHGLLVEVDCVPVLAEDGVVLEVGLEANLGADTVVDELEDASSVISVEAGVFSIDLGGDVGRDELCALRCSGSGKLTVFIK
jgi:hypothetical protein